MSPTENSVFGTYYAGTLAGTSLGDMMYPLDGDDRIYGYGGDYILASYGNDLVEPGFGNDTGTQGVRIDLAADLATRGGETDYLFEVEDADGSRNADTVRGDNAANALGGADGNDSVYGLGGADTLRGGNGDDLLEPGFGDDAVYGGPGIDKVSCYNDSLFGRGGNDLLRGAGGSGNDVFDHNQVGESPRSSGRTTSDIITDFTRFADKIDLSTIDARTATSANEAFIFLAAKGAKFMAAGQVRWYHSSGNTVVVASDGGDTAAEFQLLIAGLKTMAAGDFVL